MTKKIVLACIFSATALFSCKKKEDKIKVSNRGIQNETLFNRFQHAFPVKPIKHTGKPTEMTFDKMSHDFGTIKQGDKVSTEFGFTNTGKTDLTIYEAKGSCGCTVPEYPKTPIKPGEKGVIKVQFNSAGKTGKQEKSVFLNANTKNGNEILKITANIEEKAEKTK